MQNKIRDYWESSTPMQFKEENWHYWQKREFRYSLQNYMAETFKFRDWADKFVLDFGCGAGIDSLEFARNGAVVTATDITENACSLTMKHRDEYFEGTPGLVRLRVDWLEDPTVLPYKNNSFDLVYSYGVLHHIPDIEVILREIWRVLKPGGKIMAMVYNRDSLLFAYSILDRAYSNWEIPNTVDSDDAIASRYSERNLNCPYTHCYTKDEAHTLFSQYFGKIDIEVKFSVIDLPDRRKVTFMVQDDPGLGWHLVIKGEK